MAPPPDPPGPSPPRPLGQRLVERWRGWRTGRTLLRSEDPEPTLERVVSQAATYAQCVDPRYARWCRAIGEAPKLHRKQWEFVYVLRALEQAGIFERPVRGLGFGVGREPLVAALAARVRPGSRLLATDLPPDHPGAEPWRASGAYGGGKAVLNERQLCPEETFEDVVTYAHVDMRDLHGLEGGLDFLWSSCALEHLGSLEAGLDFVRAALELLAPGGIAVHTTELNVTSGTDTVTSGPVVLYRRGDLRALAAELGARGHRIQLNFQSGAAPADRSVDVPPYTGTHHLKMLYGRFATTSFGLSIVRG